MKRTTVGLILVGLFAGVVASQAGLYATPLLNASFESVENGGVPGGWGYVIDDWSESPDNTQVFYEQSSGIGLVGDGLIWVGFETGGTLYQDIGTVDDNQAYNLTALIGARWGTSFVTGAFSLYAGGAPGDAADDIALSSFATLISSNQVTVADGISTGDLDVYSVSVDLATGTGHTGETLWLQIESVEGKDYFDNVAIVAIPEPGTLGLLAAFGGSLVVIRRKMRR